MSNKQFPEKDNPVEALQLAIAFEEGLKRQKTYVYINQETRVEGASVYSE